MASSLRPTFRIGRKKIYLPDFTVAMVNTSLRPTQAKFQVPLWFSKLDIRDYLWHVYGVEILNTRSYVAQQPVQQGKDKDIRPAQKRWHRPRSLKYMTVELVKPFVWPSMKETENDPKKIPDFGHEELKNAEMWSEEIQGSRSSLKDTIVPKERRERMREQAQQLLEGKVKWTSPASKMPSQLPSFR